jgi:hypothetical protein
MLRRWVVLILWMALPWSGSSVLAQEPETVKLSLHPQRAEEGNGIRLLPASDELRDGNAAVVMLRILWEQNHFIREIQPRIHELRALPYDDPQVLNEFPFDYFASQLRRAAYMRTADWHYPLDERPLATVLLPDLQGMRDYVGRGMSLWIGQRIARGELEQAREGLRTQLACARHLARTPILINQLVSISLMEESLQRMEILLQQPRSENLYWALSMLPDEPVDFAASANWERQFLLSLPAFRAGIPEVGSERWKQAADELAKYLPEMSEVEGTNATLPALAAESLELARQWLQGEPGFSPEELTQMSREELAMRWLMHQSAQLLGRAEAYASLPPVEAVPRLAALFNEVNEKRHGLGVAGTFFAGNPLNWYLSFRRFDRRVKALMTVEAIRDWSAEHQGQLPSSLEELRLPAPRDPLTGRPFSYQLANGQATLEMELMEGIGPAIQNRKLYQIEITASPE